MSKLLPPDHLRQYPMDEPAGRLLCALHQRKPGPEWRVKWQSYGPGERRPLADVWEYISEVEIGRTFLRFGRPCGRLSSDWNNATAFYGAIIDGIGLRVYADYSGPSFDLYVGDDLDRDWEWWAQDFRVNTRLYNEPRRHLHYTGAASADGRYFCAGRIPPYLVHTNDLGREYDPACTGRHFGWAFVADPAAEPGPTPGGLDAPKTLSTAKVFAHVTAEIERLAALAEAQ